MKNIQRKYQDEECKHPILNYHLDVYYCGWCMKTLTKEFVEKQRKDINKEVNKEFKSLLTKSKELGFH